MATDELAERVKAAITAEEGETAVVSAERFISALEEFLHAQGFATAD